MAGSGGCWAGTLLGAQEKSVADAVTTPELQDEGTNGIITCLFFFNINKRSMFGAANDLQISSFFSANAYIFLTANIAESVSCRGNESSRAAEWF